MTLALGLLLVMATIGAIDGTYYHTLKFRLYDQPSARLETVTHVFRAWSMAFAVWLLAHHVPVGGWYWALVAVFAFDFVDDVVDVAIEPRSRAPLGGLPPREYLIHMIVMGLAGAAWVSFIAAGWAQRAAPTALLPHPLPAWVVWYARAVAVGALLMGLQDLGLLVRSVVRARRATAPG